MFPHLSNSISTYFRKIDQSGNNRISYSYKYRWFINSPFTYWWVLCRITIIDFQWIFHPIVSGLVNLPKNRFYGLGGSGKQMGIVFTKLSMFSRLFHILRGFVTYIKWDSLYIGLAFPYIPPWTFWFTKEYIVFVDDWSNG